MKALPLGIHNSSYQSAALQVTLGQTRLVFNPGLTCTAQGRDAVLRKEAEERLAASVRRAHAVLITDYQHVDLGLLPQLPSETPLYIKTPETLQDWSAFQEHILPLGATGRRLVMAEGARLQLGEAEVVSAPLQCGSLKDGSQRHLAVTVRGEGRTLAYVSGLRNPLTAAARNHLIAQRPDMLYLGQQRRCVVCSADGGGLLATCWCWSRRRVHASLWRGFLSGTISVPSCCKGRYRQDG